MKWINQNSTSIGSNNLFYHFFRKCFCFLTPPFLVHHSIFVVIRCVRYVCNVHCVMQDKERPYFYRVITKSINTHCSTLFNQYFNNLNAVVSFSLCRCCYNLRDIFWLNTIIICNKITHNLLFLLNKMPQLIH